MTEEAADATLFDLFDIMQAAAASCGAFACRFVRLDPSEARTLAPVYDRLVCSIHIHTWHPTTSILGVWIQHPLSFVQMA
jgi:hypothetical protein